MKAKRIISLLLAVITVFAAMGILSSCGKNAGNIKLSSKVVDVDLKGYSVLYADAANKTRFAQSLFATLADKVGALSGESVVARAATKAKTGPEDPEILIGQTGRTESIEAFNSIKGDGFVIKVTDKKIAIVGTNNLLTFQAVSYFIRNYLDTAEGKTISVNETVSSNKVDMIKVADPDVEENAYTFIYDEKLHDSVQHPDPVFVSTYGSRDMREYPVQAIDTVLASLTAISGQKSKAFNIVKSSESVDGPRFYMGKQSDDLSKSCLEKLGGGEYGIFVENGDYVITAWSDSALIAANDVFTELLGEATFETDGGKYVAFPEGFELIGTANENWITDFPKPEGVTLYNTYDTANDALQYLYMGETVTEAAFTTYCNTLADSGYTLLQENEIEGSKFATLVNNDKEHMLYVSYNAFTHTEEYGKFEDWYASDYDEKLLRVISMSTDADYVVPDKKILSPQGYAKKTNTKVTAIGLGSGAVGMGYVVTLEDGSFIIFDGGAMGDSAQEHIQIWKILTGLHKEIFGEGSSEPIRIAAWIITHSHGDHYGVPRKFLQTYGNEGSLQMDYLIGNFGVKGSFYPVFNDDSGRMGADGTIKEMQAVTKKPFKFLKAHSGQKFYFANVEVEVLMTYEDHNPNPIINTNDTNTVVRFAASSKENPKADPYTMIWLGDANQRQSRYMCAMYGDYLKADLVQLAHHGNVGSENALYNTINADVVLFPNSVSAYSRYCDPTNKKTNYAYDVDYNIVHVNTYTKYVIVSGVDFHTTFTIDNNCEAVYTFTCAMTGVTVPETTDKLEGGNVVKIR